MKNRKLQKGLTLAEILVAVAIVIILMSIVMTVATRIDARAKEELTGGTMAILNAALQEFRDFGFEYKDSKYEGLGFPIDCNDFEKGELEITIREALGYGSVTINGGHNIEYSGCEALYFLLSKVPSSRKTLEQIDKSLITNEDENREPIVILIGEEEYPFYRVLDAWGNTLKYDYYDESNPPDEARTFPLIISAGADREFGNSDDITNR